MRRLLTGALAAVVPALMVSAMLVGCSGDNKGGDNTKKDKTEPEPSGQKKALDTKGTATFKGRVTLAGDPPNTKALDENIKGLIDKNAQDKDYCLKGGPDETGQQEWEFGKDKGVGNVFVWVAPPDGTYFKLDWDKKPWLEGGKKKDVIIDQPHCAFKPHAAVVFPGAFEDGDTLKKSGQSLVIENTASITHNTNWQGGEVNKSGNKLIPTKGEPLPIPGLKPSDDPLLINCDIHKWMSAVVRLYDHPYATVTDKDGNFEIKDVPAGAELRVFVWHEAADNPKKGKKVDDVKFEDGKEVKKDYTVKAK
jgi:hypothetical protein